jgi:hypothetical protein
MGKTGALAERLRGVRFDLYGEHGAPELARELGLPVRTWIDYELGATIPAEVLLHFLILTHAEPLWLLQGQGERFRTANWSTLHRLHGVAPERHDCGGQTGE